MGFVKRIWAYLARTQPVPIRVLHLMVILLVVSQLITSNLVRLDQVGYGAAFSWGTWAHILPGLTLAAIMTIFVLVELFCRGLKDFYPYLWGNLAQLKSDVKQLARLKLPAAEPGGLPAVVQGLGLVLLCLTLLSGLAWYLLVQSNAGTAHAAVAVHEALTGLVVVYVIGHGGMGLLHMLLWLRSTKSVTTDAA